MIEAPARWGAHRRARPRIRARKIVHAENLAAQTHAAIIRPGDAKKMMQSDTERGAAGVSRLGRYILISPKLFKNAL